MRRRIGLGDVIWTTPIVKALARAHRPCRIDVATAYADVFRGSPWVAAVVPPDHPADGYDHVIDLDLAYERRRGRHVLAAYAEVAGIAIGDPRPEMLLRPEDYQPVAAALAERNWSGIGVQRIVAAHMAATSPDRVWPPGHWKSLTLSLLERPELGLVLVGRNADFNIRTSLLDAAIRDRVVSLVNHCTIPQTAAAIAVSDVLVAPDSGLSHVAAAVGTRAVVLYGMTDPRNYLPLHGSAEGIWTTAECRGCIADIAPEQSPLCRFGKAHCYDLIAPETVLDATWRALAGLSGTAGWMQRLALAAAPAAAERSDSIPADPGGRNQRRRSERAASASDNRPETGDV